MRPNDKSLGGQNFRALCPPLAGWLAGLAGWLAGCNSLKARVKAKEKGGGREPPSKSWRRTESGTVGNVTEMKREREASSVEDRGLIWNCIRLDLTR